MVAALLVLFGVSCSSDDDSEPQCMYGTPTGTFEAKGFVSDEENNPVEEAKILVTKVMENSTDFYYAEAKTDASGNYEIPPTRDFPYQKLKVVCIPPGDALEPDSVIVSVTYDDKGESPWDMGAASFTADFKLKSAQ